MVNGGHGASLRQPFGSPTWRGGRGGARPAEVARAHAVATVLLPADVALGGVTQDAMLELRQAAVVGADHLQVVHMVAVS